jgi:hypothetical protein
MKDQQLCQEKNCRDKATDGIYCAVHAKLLREKISTELEPFKKKNTFQFPKEKMYTL